MSFRLMAPPFRLSFLHLGTSSACYTGVFLQLLRHVYLNQSQLSEQANPCELFSRGFYGWRAARFLQVESYSRLNDGNNVWSGRWCPSRQLFEDGPEFSCHQSLPGNTKQQETRFPTRRYTAAETTEGTTQTKSDSNPCSTRYSLTAEVS